MKWCEVESTGLLLDFLKLLISSPQGEPKRLAGTA